MIILYHIQSLLTCEHHGFDNLSNKTESQPISIFIQNVANLEFDDLTNLTDIQMSQVIS